MGKIDLIEQMLQLGQELQDLLVETKNSYPEAIPPGLAESMMIMENIRKNRKVAIKRLSKYSDQELFNLLQHRRGQLDNLKKLHKVYKALNNMDIEPDSPIRQTIH